MNIQELSKKPFGELTSGERRLLAKVAKQFRIIKSSEAGIQKSQARIRKLAEEGAKLESGIEKFAQSIEDAKLVIAAVERAASAEEAEKATASAKDSDEGNGVDETAEQGATV